MALNLDLLSQNFERIREQVTAAAKKAGRNENEVEILAATKYLPIEELPILAQAGVKLVGENRAQDLVEKHARYGDLFQWDFIGQLQSRKVKDILPITRLIHSVASHSALEQIEARSEEPVELLLQINIAGEASKAGIPLDQLDLFIERASQLESVRFTGLMAMPPLAADSEESRPYFAKVRELAAQLSERWRPHNFECLSIGTSQDYLVAVEEGATTVRLGSALWN